MAYLPQQPYTAPGIINTAQPNQGVWVGGGLLDCFRDCETCCVTYWLPCLTYADNRGKIEGKAGGGGGDFCLYCIVLTCTGCHCFLGIGPRSDLRRKYGLPEDPCGDCCVHFWCHSCAMCQEARELKARPLTQWPVVGMLQQQQQPGTMPAPGQPAQGYPGPPQQQQPQYGVEPTKV